MNVRCNGTIEAGQESAMCFGRLGLISTGAGDRAQEGAEVQSSPSSHKGYVHRDL
jgi:hypothetical protein